MRAWPPSRATGRRKGLEMYEEFYKLQARPFLMAPDPTFMFWSENHILAYSMLNYAIATRAPITVVTGEVGAGKTTLLRQLLRDIPDDVTVSLSSNIQSGKGELLEWILAGFGESIASDEGYVRLAQRFQDYVIGRYAAGSRVILMIDEAQNLSAQSLEELRMLSNINSDGDEILQIVLTGQPQLRTLLNDPDLTQFAQRISVDFHLEALQPEDVEKYIDARLAHAGAQWRIFPTGTAHVVAEVTRGVPRLVNVLCDLCLVYGYSAQKKVIDEALLGEFLASARKRGIYGQFAQTREGPQLVSAAR